MNSIHSTPLPDEGYQEYLNMAQQAQSPAQGADSWGGARPPEVDAECDTPAESRAQSSGYEEQDAVSPQRASETGSPSRPQQRFYSNSAAMCVECADVDKHGQTARHLMVEMAPAKNKAADWKKKVIMQLSTEEAAQLAACLLGYVPAVEFQRPGKGIRFERQTGNLFARASEKKREGQVMCPMPLAPDAVFMLTGFVVGHLHSVWPGGPDALVPALRGAFSLQQRAGT